MKELLHRSMHESLSDPESRELNAALEQSAALRAEKEALEQMTGLLSAHQQAFSPGFKERVMEGIKQPGGKVVKLDFTAGLTRAFMRYSLAGAAAILIIVLGVWVAEGQLSLETLSGTAALSEDNLSTFLVYEF